MKESNKLSVDALAENKYPIHPNYADLLDTLDWEIYINHLRMAFKEGYAASEATVGQQVGDIYFIIDVSKELPEKSGWYNCYCGDEFLGNDIFLKGNSSTRRLHIG